MRYDQNLARTVDRRSVLKGFGAGAAVAFGGLSSISMEASAHEDSTVGQAMICDVGNSKTFTSQMPLASDPSGERGTVVHATSGGQSTRDYVCSTVDLSDFEYTLGTIADSGLSYEYYEGSNNTGAAPDEVFLTIKSGDTYHVAYRTHDADTGSEVWNTRNVGAELRSSGWRTTQIDSSQIDPENRLAMTTNQAITNAISLLRGESSTSLLNEFGNDARVVAVTIGRGSVMNEVVIDTYFDSLQVAGDSFAIPGIVVLNAIFDNVQYSTEAFHVHLSFAEALSGVSLEDIDVSSVRLSRYSEIGPPVPGTDVESTAVETENGNTGRINEFGLRADFNREAIGEQASVGETVMVYGDFAYPDAVDHPLGFIATSPLEVNH